MWASASNLLYDFLKLIYSFLGSWGWSIIVLTLLIRLLLHPLNKKQMVSMQKMQRLQPRIKVLQEKYANDREKLGRETMALYKENNVNPAAGCLPVVLQLPILILLFNVLRSANFGGATFLGISLEQSLTALLAQVSSMSYPAGTQPGVFAVIGHLLSHPAGLAQISVYGMNLLLLVGITVLTYLQQKISATGTQDMGMLMVIMPIMLAFITLSLPGGVALYWFVSNAIGVGQQYFINRKVANEEKPQLYKEKPKVEEPRS